MGHVNLQGRVAIVTGAGGGLGRSHALTLARRGAAVVVNDIGGAVDGTGGSDAAEAVAEQIRADGGRAVSNRDSVATAAGGQAMVDQAVAEFGAVDIVVANAGIIRDNLWEDYTEEDFRDMLDVHLCGSFWVTQAAYRVMRERKYGRVVFTSSSSALFGMPYSPGYCAGKAGVVGLMHSLAVEGRDYNVLANAIDPIAFTRMTASAFGPDRAELTRPELVSELVAYLVSEECALTRRILNAGAGEYARVFIGRTAGVKVDTSRPVEAETIADLIDDIVDTSTVSDPKDVMDMLSGVFGKAFGYGGADPD